MMVGIIDFKLSTHKIHWMCRTLAPVMDGLWTWGNIGILSQEKQAKIKLSIKENCKPFTKANGFSFPHTVLFLDVLQKSRERLSIIHQLSIE